MIPESPAYEQACKGRIEKKKKKLVPTCVAVWIRAAFQNGNESRWARCISNSRSSTYRRVEQGWRGVHSCAVYGGLLPLAPWRFNSRLEHLVITDPSFLLVSSLKFNPAIFLTIFKSFFFILIVRGGVSSLSISFHHYILTQNWIPYYVSIIAFNLPIVESQWLANWFVYRETNTKEAVD